MQRPAGFNKLCRTLNVAPYQIVERPDSIPERASSNGGVFHRGQIVWTSESPIAATVTNLAIGFVDGLGHVLIDPRMLRLAESSSFSRN